MIDTFGSPADPAVLLIAGVGSSMDWWDPEFCRLLADGGRYVIRYDHRDTGDAPSYPPGRPGYTWDDLVDDAPAVLDEVGVDAAHLVGISMGGMLAQLVTLNHPSRVRSLVLMSTTAGAGDEDLPGPVGLESLPEPVWTDDAAVVEYLVASQRQLAAKPFDDEETRALARVAVSRTKNNESSQKNHHAAEGGSAGRHRLGEITVPVLVIHGDEDPLFPLPHGEALAREIPGARLVVLPRTGHEFPSRNWPAVLPELLLHTSSGGQR
jgi:pimeloyl-ACP methyl ester carboxylesterase